MAGLTKIVLDASAIDRALTRIAHEIVEGNKGARELALVGIVSRGDVLAAKLAERIKHIDGVVVPVGSLGNSFYRADFAIHLNPAVYPPPIPVAVHGHTLP